MRIDMAKLRALAEKATPGEWSSGRLFMSNSGLPRRTILGPNGDQSGERIACDLLLHDAAYVVAAQPQTILSLLDRLAALERVREAAEAFRSELIAGVGDAVRRFDHAGMKLDATLTAAEGSPDAA